MAKFTETFEKALAEHYANLKKWNEQDVVTFPVHSKEPIGAIPKDSVRTFSTGANRHVADHKPDYEAFLSPYVIRVYAQYMQTHQTLTDGTTRDGDNWQKGMPLDAYMKSAWRHFQNWWELHREGSAVDFDGEGVDFEDALCGLLFNVMGYLHERNRQRQF